MYLKKFLDKNTIKRVMFFVFAILSVGGVANYLNIGTKLDNVNNIIWLPLFGVYMYVYNKITYSRGKCIVSILMSIFTACVLIYGSQLEHCNDILWTKITAIKLFMLVFSFIPIYIKVIDILERISNKEPEELKVGEKKFFFIEFGILLLFGFLGFLALYPGVYGYDAGYEIMQIQFDDVAITTHFSVLYSYILYGFINLGNVLFKSYNAGFAMYSFMQMLAMTYVATKICVFAYKTCKNRGVLYGATLFFCIFPLHIIMMLSAAQDTLFCGALTLFIIELFDCVSSEEEFWKKKWNPIRFVLISLFMCLIRNNGIYILLIPAVLSIMFIKKYKIRTIAMYVVIVAVFFIYKGPVLKALKVVDIDSTREMSSVPCQQLARSYTYREDTFSLEEKEELNKIFAYNDGKLFEYYTLNPSISDSVKATMDVKYVEDNKGKVIEFYLKQFLDDPENYVEGFLFNGLGFWYPDKTYPDPRIYHPYIEFEMLDAKKWNERYIEIERHSVIPLYEKAMKIVVEKNANKKIPVVSLIFTCGTYFMLLVFATVYVIYKKKIRELYGFSAIWGYYLTLLLSPVCIYRYCYALFLCAPVMIAIMLKKKKIE